MDKYEEFSDDLFDEILGLYGHDGYNVETVAYILGVSEEKVDEIIERYDIGFGEY
jgi:transposase